MTQLQISQKESLVDERLSIRVTGCQPGSVVKIQACISILKKSSEATFKTDENGELDLDKHAPISGSYDWVDGMGLIWSMLPDAIKETPSLPNYSLDPFQVDFTITSEDGSQQTQSVTRYWVTEGVTRKEVRDGELRGVCFYPPGEGPFPAVIIVSGSGGGISETRAAMFANHGYVALTLGYFAYEDRPKWLQNIPLEYFEEAAHWLGKQDVVDENKLVITGGSRGGELSLVLGATFKFFKAVVANVPSSQVWSGFGGEKGYTQPAWVYKGKPVGFYLPKAREEYYAEPSEPVKEPIPLTPMFLESMKDEDFIKASTIPVENTSAPILLVSGEDDQMWPSSMFSERVMARLKEHNFPYPYKHCSYPGAGHAIVAGYLPLIPNHSIHPVDGQDYAFGGNPKDQAFANADSWQQVLKFLKENL
jgi:dienelactone hydrolase